MPRYMLWLCLGLLLGPVIVDVESKLGIENSAMQIVGVVIAGAILFGIYLLMLTRRVTRR